MKNLSLNQILSEAIFEGKSVLFVAPSRMAKIQMEKVEKILSQTASKVTDKWEIKLNNGATIRTVPCVEQIRGYRAKIVAICGDEIPEEKMQEIIIPMVSIGGEVVKLEES